jgi:cyclophilin family peptidyl-prolyl cis-trans isomerase
VSKRTRNRQLARQAALRQQEKRAKQRRRQAITIVVALAIFLAGSAGLFLWVTGGDETPIAAPTGPSASGPSGATKASGPSGATKASGPSGATGHQKPGTKTGTVQAAPGPDTVACDAEKPAAAEDPKPQFNAPKRVTKPDETYTATMRTSCGDIVIELLNDRAPRTVNSFVFLAQQGYFDGTRFHRIDTSIDVIQGGDPTGTGTGGPGYSIPDELTGDESYAPGTLAMANAGANTGGSQFFIIFGPNGHNLDANPNYTIFGQITDGLDVAQQIGALDIKDPNAAAAGDLSGQQPAEAVYIDSVTISSTKS